MGAVVAALSAVVGAHASAAAPTRAAAGAGTSDATYSCLVGHQHSVNVYGSVTLPPQNGKPQPGLLMVTTGAKTVSKNGVTTTVSQVGLAAKKDSLKIDKSSCTRLKHQIPLKPKGLHDPTTATPNLFGRVNAQCPASAHVLVRLRLEIKAGVPTHALLAVRTDGVKKRPLAFYNWTSGKLTAYTAGSCTILG